MYLTKQKCTFCHHISSDKMVPFANLSLFPAVVSYDEKGRGGQVVYKAQMHTFSVLIP